MKRIIYLFLSICFVSLYGCSIRQSDYYGRVLFDDGLGKCKAYYAINEREAKDIDCYKIERAKDGEIIKISFLSKSMPAIDNNWFECSVVSIEVKPGIRIIRNYDVNNMPMKDHQGIYCYKLWLDIKGAPIAMRNYDEKGRPMKDKYNVASYRYETDSKGRAIRVRQYNHKGQQIVNADGRYEIAYEYDNNGNANKLSNYGSDGKLMLDNYNSASIVSRNNQIGAPEEARFLGLDGNLTVRTDRLTKGASMIKGVYDKYSYPVGVTRYDINGNVLKGE